MAKTNAPNEGPFEARWRVGEVLKRERITAYRLANHLSGNLTYPTVYAYAKRPPMRPDTRALGWVLHGINELRRREKPYELAELFDIVDRP